MFRTFSLQYAAYAVSIFLLGCDSTISQWVGDRSRTTPGSSTTIQNPVLSASSQVLKMFNGPGIDSGLPTKISGGVPPYSFSIISGPGSINSSTGMYRQPLSWDSTVIEVKDAVNQKVNLSIKNFPILTDEAIYAMQMDGDNLYIGGSFETVAPSYNPSFVILSQTDGSLSSNPCNYKRKLESSGFGVTQDVAIAGNSIFFGGAGASYGGDPVSGLVKINSQTCELDETFNTNAKTMVGSVSSLHIDAAEGFIYVGGTITSYNGQAVQNLIKVDMVTGALDTTFTQSTGFDLGVVSLAGNSSSLFVGGGFAAYRGSPANQLAKLSKSSGVLDTTFTQATGVDATSVHQLLILNTSLYVATSKFGGNPAYRGAACGHVLKLDLTSGNIDTTFSQDPAFGTPYKVYSIATDGTSIFAAGEFSTYRGVASPNVIKIDATTGALVPAFTAGGGAIGGGGFYVSFDSVTQSLFIQTFGQVYNGTATTRAMIKVDKTSGTVDATFDSGMAITLSNYMSSNVGFLPNAEMIVLPYSAPLSRGTVKSKLAKLNLATGEWDQSFNTGTGFDSTVKTLLVHGNYIYVGGTFTTYNGQPALRLAKIDKNTGALDTTFTQATGVASASTPSVNALAVDAAGTGLYVCGSMQTYRGTGAQGIARVLIANGNLDTTFTQATGMNGICNSVIFANSSVYAGGNFGTYRGAAGQYLLKLDPVSGVMDATFTPSVGPAGGDVKSVFVDGSDLYFAGAFTLYRAVAAPFLAKVNLNSGVLDTTYSQTTSSNTGLAMLGIFDSMVFATSANGIPVSTYRAEAVSNLIGVSTTNSALSPLYKTSGFNSRATAMLKYNGKYLFGGTFTSYKGELAPYFTIVNPATGLMP